MEGLHPLEGKSCLLQILQCDIGLGDIPPCFSGFGMIGEREGEVLKGEPCVLVLLHLSLGQSQVESGFDPL